MRVLIIDDQQERHDIFLRRHQDDETVSVYDYKQACDALSAWQFDLVYFDHDLGFEKWSKTGYDVAVFVASLPAPQRPMAAIVHSWNRPGAERIARTLASAGVNVTISPFKL